MEVIGSSPTNPTYTASLANAGFAVLASGNITVFRVLRLFYVAVLPPSVLGLACAQPVNVL